MAIYLLNVGSIFIYWLICREFRGNEYNYKKAVNFFMTIICIQMVAILGFRGTEVGIDTYAYERRFNTYRFMTLEEIFNNSQEIGFSLLIRVVDFFTDEYHLFVLICAIITIVPIIISISKCSVNPFLSVFLFITFDYYTFMFSGMRQGIAYALCIFSYIFIRDRKFIKYLVVVLLAAQFHKSAYFFLPAYFITQVKIDKKAIISMAVMFVLVYVFKGRMFNYVVEMMYDSYEITNTNPFGILVLILTMTILGIMFKENALRKDKTFNCCLMLLCVGAVLLPFISIGTNAKRMVEYYCIFQIFVIPGILNGIENENLRVLANMAIIIGAFALWSLYLTIDTYYTVPYIPFWSV